MGLKSLGIQTVKLSDTHTSLSFINKTDWTLTLLKCLKLPMGNRCSNLLEHLQTEMEIQHITNFVQF